MAYACVWVGGCGLCRYCACEVHSAYRRVLLPYLYPHTYMHTYIHTCIHTYILTGLYLLCPRDQHYSDVRSVPPALYTCAHIYIYIYIYVCMYANIYVIMQQHYNTSGSICITYVHVCRYGRYLCTYIYVCVCVCMPVCVCVLIDRYNHTHKHTHKHLSLIYIYIYIYIYVCVCVCVC